MAESRAVASLSLTIGVAVATLLVTGAIVAGPAILDCSRTPGGVGACLHARAVDHGLLHETPAPSTDPPHAAGWIEANATEYDAPPASSAILLPGTGRIGAEGTTRASGQLAADVAVGPDNGGLLARGTASSPAPDVRLSLTGPNGGLGATATESAATPATRPPPAFDDRTGSLVADTEVVEPPGQGSSLAIEGPAGALAAMAADGPLPVPAQVALAGQVGRISTAAGNDLPVSGPPLLVQAPAGRTGAGTSSGPVPRPAAAAIGAPAGEVATGSAALTALAPYPSVRLAPPHGDLGAVGVPSEPVGALVSNVAPGAGVLDAGGSPAPASRPPVAVVPEPLAPPPVPAPPPPDWGTLKAALPTDQLVEQIVVTPVTPMPSLIAPRPKRPAVEQASTIKPKHPAPKYDPRYPNVLVLPPPNTGENSSFASLEVR